MAALPQSQLRYVRISSGRRAAPLIGFTLAEMANG
jgi:hypothetical protein